MTIILFQQVRRNTILEILAGIREPEFNCMCKIVEGLGICVHELCGDMRWLCRRIHLQS